MSPPQFAAIPDLVLGNLAGRPEADWHRAPPGKWTPAGRLPADHADRLDAVWPGGARADPAGRAAGRARRRAAAAGRRGALPDARARIAAGPARRSVREKSRAGRSHPARMDPVSHPTLRASRPADSRQAGIVSSKSKRKLTVRVPNPKAPVKERLKTPSHKVHRSAKQYRRRGKSIGTGLRTTDRRRLDGERGLSASGGVARLFSR